MAGFWRQNNPQGAAVNTGSSLDKFLCSLEQYSSSSFLAAEPGGGVGGRGVEGTFFPAYLPLRQANGDYYPVLAPVPSDAGARFCALTDEDWMGRGELAGRSLRGARPLLERTIEGRHIDDF